MTRSSLPRLCFLWGGTLLWEPFKTLTGNPHYQPIHLLHDSLESKRKLMNRLRVAGQCCNEETATFLDTMVRQIVYQRWRAGSRFTKYLTMFATKRREFSVWNVTPFLNSSPLFGPIVNFQSKCSFMQFHYLSHEAAKDSMFWLGFHFDYLSPHQVFQAKITIITSTSSITAVLGEVIRCWSSYTGSNHRPLFI